MIKDKSGPLYLLGPDLDYIDGSEDHILTVLQNTFDRSAGSDELLGRIKDWPTAYHFSPARHNLLNPFHFSAQHRVLEIGCGTGVNLRAIAETGAEVVGVEGTKVRAIAARTRCEGLDNVSIYAGDIKSLPNIGLFDAVLLIGVLEYSGSIQGGLGGPDELLQVALRHLKNDGELILAIENQIGLKYLLSYPEDHIGLPWIGVEGYRERSGPRTWSRKQLSSMLTRNGLTNQRWLFPFPDYKHPTIILSQELLISEHGCRLVKNFVRTPVVDYSGSPSFVCDSISAFGVMVDAGLTAEISNSFLVTGSRTHNKSSLTDSREVAWLGHIGRLKKWRTARTIVASNEGFVLNTPLDKFSDASEDWLSNIRTGICEVIDGVPLDDLINQSLRQKNLEETRVSLERYRRFLEKHVIERNPLEPHNPFSGSDLPQHLPPEFLDCIPQNLISVGDELTFIDREWVAISTISLTKIWIRGLMCVAVNAINRKTPLFFTDARTVIDSICHLSEIIGISIQRLEVESVIYSDEPQLQSLVSGQSVAVNTVHIEHQMNSLARPTSQTSSSQDMTLVNEKIEELKLVNQQLQELKLERQHLTNRVELLSGTAADLHSALRKTRESVSYRIGNFFVQPIYLLMTRLLKRQN